MKYFRKLEGDRIYLSPMNVEDLEQYTKWLNDLAVTINLGQASGCFSLVAEKDALDRMVKEGHNYAVVLKDDDRLIGNCSLFDINHIHRKAEIGLFIGEEEHRGKGYGPEAMRLILAYGFKVLNLNNVMLRVFAFNERAVKAYEKVGFKVFGRRSQAYYLDNEYYDEIYMELLAKDYKTDLLDSKLKSSRCR